MNILSLVDKKAKLLILSMAVCLGGLSSLAAQTTAVENLNGNYPTYNVFFNGSVQQFNGSVGGGPVGGTINTLNAVFFCFDLNHDINVTTNYTVNVLSPTQGNLAGLSGFSSYFVNVASPTNVQIATTLLANNYSESLSTNQINALQLAIWAILYDWNGSNQPTDISNSGAGIFYVNSGLGSGAGSIGSYLSSYLVTAQGYNSGNFTTGAWNLLYDPSSTNPWQTLEGMTVPEPQTYLLMGSLLAFSSCYMRKKKKSSKKAGV